jgi:hypothetical protein
MYQNFIISYLYETQHVSGDTPPIIRSIKLHWQPLVFIIRGRLLDVWLVEVVQRSSNSSVTPTGSDIGEHYQML